MSFGHLALEHVFEPSEPDAPTLLLLHGTGGGMNDLLDIGRDVAPGWNILSPQGAVMEGEMRRWFRRFAHNVFDEEDVRARAEELADFVHEACDMYGLERRHVVAFGYSNGANVATATLYARPQTFSGVVLVRPMPPYRPDPPPDLWNRRVLVCGGEADEYVPPQGAEELAESMAAWGAKVETFWHPGGHALSSGDVEAARAFIATF